MDGRARCASCACCCQGSCVRRSGRAGTIGFRAGPRKSGMPVGLASPNYPRKRPSRIAVSTSPLCHDRKFPCPKPTLGVARRPTYLVPLAAKVARELMIIPEALLRKDPWQNGLDPPLDEMAL